MRRVSDAPPQSVAHSMRRDGALHLKSAIRAIASYLAFLAAGSRNSPSWR